ncbi:MAG TPA: tungsten ABC transporter permease, partial [Delftia acidovorans]|nr:tungsten ABC transporter permease [Delftia acidovorans]
MEPICHPRRHLLGALPALAALSGCASLPAEAISVDVAVVGGLSLCGVWPRL